MCHCFGPVEEMSETERAEVRTEHTIKELKAEYSSEELDRLGVSG